MSNLQPNERARENRRKNTPTNVTSTRHNGPSGGKSGQTNILALMILTNSYTRWYCCRRHYCSIHTWWRWWWWRWWWWWWWFNTAAGDDVVVADEDDEDEVGDGDVDSDYAATADNDVVAADEGDAIGDRDDDGGGGSDAAVICVCWNVSGSHSPLTVLLLSCLHYAH